MPVVTFFLVVLLLDRLDDEVQASQRQVGVEREDRAEHRVRERHHADRDAQHLDEREGGPCLADADDRRRAEDRSRAAAGCVEAEDLVDARGAQTRADLHAPREAVVATLAAEVEQNGDTDAVLGDAQRGDVVAAATFGVVDAVTEAHDAADVEQLIPLLCRCRARRAIGRPIGRLERKCRRGNVGLHLQRGCTTFIGERHVRRSREQQHRDQPGTDDTYLAHVNLL